MPINKTDVDFISSQAAIMRVSGVKLQKINAEKGLVTLRIDADGLGSAPNQVLWFSYNPLFFKPDLKPSKDLAEYGASILAVYENNIATGKTGQVPLLQGMTNCDSKNVKEYTEVVEALQTLGESATPDQVVEVLKDYLIDRGYGNGFGAILKQQKEKVDNGDGTVTWANTPYLKIDNRVDSDSQKARKGFWRNDEKGRKAQIKRAEKSENEPKSNKPWFVCTFDENGCAF